MEEEEVKSASEELRKKAEEIFENNNLKSEISFSAIDAMKLVHELKVHQIELEMQNEELQIHNSELTQDKKDTSDNATEKYMRLYEYAPSGYFSLNSEGEIVALNLNAARMLGKERSALLNSRLGFFLTEDSKPVFNNFLKKLFHGDSETTCELELIVADRSTVFLHIAGIHTKNENFGFLSALDITESKQDEIYRELSREILQILNEPGDITNLIKRVIATMKVTLGIDAVGIRLQEGEDFPYLAQKGFSDNFLFTENNLIEHDSDGKVTRDTNGNVCLACNFGLVISGNIDPASPLSTPGGSWWTNNSTQLLEGEPRNDTRFHPRNKCINQGFASMALVPIRNLNKNIGLIQLNDFRKDRFNRISIEKLEGIASHIGAALVRHQNEELLRKKEEKRLSILQTAMDGFWIVDSAGYILEVNDTYCKLSGYNRNELLSLRISDLEAGESQDEVTAHTKLVIQQGYDRFETRHRRKDGSIFDVEISTQYRPEEDQFVSFMRDITHKKLAEENLKQSELKFRKYIDHAPHGIFVANEKGQYIDANLEASIITGYSKEELLSSNLVQLIHEESLESGREHFNRVNTEGFATGEFAFVKKDGSKGYWIVDAVKLSDHVFLGFVVDITSRKQIEELLANNERLLRESQAAANIGSYSADLVNKTWTASPEMYQIFGISEDYPRTMEAWVMSVHKDYRKELVNEVLQVKSKKDRFDREYKIVRNNDQVERWVHGIGEFEYDHQMNPIRMIGTIQDITKRKQAEEMLIESEQRYHTLFEESNDAIFLVDLISGRYMDCNRLAETLTGFTREEILHMKTGTFLPQARKEELVSNMETIMSGKVLLSETEITSKGGKLIPVEFNSSLITINKKQCILSLLHDITDRREAAEALRRSEEKVRFKLQSILSPEGSIADLELSDIIDTPSIQKLMDNFYELAQIPMAIIDKNGKVLVGVGWKNICVKFHRTHPQAGLNCIESDIQLTHGIPDGEFKLYKCKNNIWDMATPINIGGEYKGNLFMGQFFFDDEPINYNLFRKQAQQYGFDEHAYLDALDNVPRFSKQKLEHAKAFFLNLSRSISQLSYGNIKLARAIEQQKKVEEALRESEESLKKAQEIAHVGSWSLNLEKNLLIWNDEMYRIFGVPPHEFPATYEGFLDSVHPEDRDAVNSAFANSILEDNDSYKVEHRIFRKNSGELRHILEKCEHVRDASGCIIRSVGMSLDITEQKQAEEALKHLNEELEERINERTAELLNLNKSLILAEEKYRTVADFTTNWEFWISPDDQMIYCSPSCERVTGYTVTEFVANPQLLYDIIHPEDFPKYLEHKKQEMQAQACVHEIRFRIIRKDGTIRWIGHFCQPVFNASGHFMGIRGSNEDINARKKSEELLKKSNLKYSLLSANITDGIFIFRNNCFEYVNRAMSHIFGYQGTELIGLGLNHLILPEYANELNFIQHAPPLNQKRSVEIGCVKKDQSIISVEFLFNYIASENVIYGVAHDITDKKQIQKNIVKAIILTEEKERTYFSKELHDGLGPLLSTIKLYLEWSKETGGKQSRQEILSKAEEIIEDSIRTVKEISNKLSPHILINFGLCSAIASFVDKLQNTSSIKIEFDCKISRRMGSEIEAAIYRATIECINNTMKYSGAKNIKIILHDSGNQLKLHYMDDGIGFDLKETIAMKKGLGLFNLQNRIQNIGGTIKMFSKPGKGVDYRIVVHI